MKASMHMLAGFGFGTHSTAGGLGETKGGPFVHYGRSLARDGRVAWTMKPSIGPSSRFAGLVRPRSQLFTVMGSTPRSWATSFCRSP